MNLFSKLFKSRDKPRNSLLGGGHWFFFGGSSSGKAVNERSAMQMTAVYACVRVLSESIAGLPLHLFRYNREGNGKVREFQHPLRIHRRLAPPSLPVQPGRKRESPGVPASPCGASSRCP